jgi:glycosyltransferase involved in cell wall biosynthesis
MLKILVSAYACEPKAGSESGIGWNFVRHLGNLHELWVITRTKNRKAIEAAIAINPLPNVHWVFYDIPGGRYLSWKGTRVVYAYHHYILWQIGSYFAARKLHRRIEFDLIQHVTFVNYWLPTLMPLLPAPFIWGPVGGGEAAPRGMSAGLGLAARCTACLRNIVQRASAYNPFVRYAAKHAAWTFTTTQETADRLLALGCSAQVLPAVALPQQEIDTLSTRNLRKGPSRARFRVVSIGDLLPVKGFATGIRGFAKFHRVHPESEYWIIGEGHERARLERTVRQLQLKDEFVFWGRVPRERALEKLAECDVLLFPSLHDSGGWVSLEAMAAGLPVICLEQGGPALQVTAETGFKIPAITPKQVITDIAEALSALYNNPELRERLGAAGRERVRTHFSWEQKARQISAVYEEVVHSKRARERAASRAKVGAPA